jgi:hypothetical protein
VTGVRALARDDGSWDIVFAERDASLHDEVSRLDDELIALWHGVYDGTRWSSLQQIPLPRGVKLSAAGISMSPLARGNENQLAWAVGARLQSGREGVIVLQRQADMWSYDVVNTRSVVLGGLVFTESSTLLFAVIAADTAISPGGFDENSLFLWSSHDGEWSAPRRLVHGGQDGPVLSSSLESLGSIPVITWSADVGDERYHLRSQLGAAGEVRTLDEDLAQFYAFSSAELSDTTQLWVTLHARPLLNEGAELRFSRLSPRSVQHMGDIPSPVLDSFRITHGERGDEILLTGALGVKDAGNVVSLVVRYRLYCGR